MYKQLNKYMYEYTVLQTNTKALTIHLQSDQSNLKIKRQKREFH